MSDNKPVERIWIDPQDSSFWNDEGNVAGLVEFVPASTVEAQLAEKDAERDAIINAVLSRVGKRWRSVAIEQTDNLEINGPTAAIVADQPGAALVAVNLALGSLHATHATELEQVRKQVEPLIAAVKMEIETYEYAMKSYDHAVKAHASGMAPRAHNEMKAALKSLEATRDQPVSSKESE